MGNTSEICATEVQEIVKNEVTQLLSDWYNIDTRLIRTFYKKDFPDDYMSIPDLIIKEVDARHRLHWWETTITDEYSILEIG